MVEVGADEGVRWSVTEALPGRPASDPWDAADRPRVIEAMAAAARALHALPVGSCPFDRRLSVTIPLARRAGEASAVLSGTVAPPEDPVVCHGDLCLPNVLVDPGTWTVTGLVDLGRLGVADRYLDLALATRSIESDELNPQFSQEDSRRFLDAYGVDQVDSDRIAFYRLLDEFL